MASLRIRNVTRKDASSICTIYNHYVLHTAVTFETEPVTVAEMVQRITTVLAAGFPFLAGEIDGEMAGYCYLHTWNTRCSYETTAEATIYLDHRHTGNGYGTLLYTQLFEQAGNNRFHAYIAGICIPNPASVHLHEKLGFRQVSSLREIGRKFGEWRDVGHWMRYPED